MTGAAPPVEGSAWLSGAGVMPDRAGSDEVAPYPMTRWLFSSVKGPT